MQCTNAPIVSVLGEEIKQDIKQLRALSDRAQAAQI